MMIFERIIDQVFLVLTEIEVFPQMSVQFLNGFFTSLKMVGEYQGNDLFSLLLFDISKSLRAGF